MAFPSPREAVGRVDLRSKSGWGDSSSLYTSPPPLTPPHHSLRSRGEGNAA